MRAIDRSERVGRSAEPPRRFRHAAAQGAMLTALVTGVREVLDDDPGEAIEESDPGNSGGPDQPVTLFFVPNNPVATVAVVRPWLF